MQRVVPRIKRLYPGGCSIIDLFMICNQLCILDPISYGSIIDSGSIMDLLMIYNIMELLSKIVLFIIHTEITNGSIRFNQTFFNKRIFDMISCSCYGERWRGEFQEAKNGQNSCINFQVKPCDM
jgi:hypothetical protein